MRKWIFGLFVTMALTLLFALPALAQSYMLDKIYASVDVPDTYTVITPDNASTYSEWLQGRGTTAEDTTTDMANRGVLLQCWDTENNTCIELTAVQNDQSKNLFDINEQSTAIRAQYRLGHFPKNDYVNLGYEFSSSDWKNTDAGRFLVLRYTYRENGQLVRHGLMRRTIRNGYEITFDLQVPGRSITNKDNTALNKVWNTFKFIQVQPLPASASAKINVTEAPPKETNSDTFNFSGTATPGVHLITVVMGLSSPTPVQTNVDVGSSGKFKIPLKLPKEGAFVVTVTADYQGEEVLDLAYSVAYQRTLLTVDVSTTVPTNVTGDTLTVQGNSTPGAQIQAFLNDELVVKKKVNSAGKFSIDVDTSKEGSYTLVLAFSKTGLADRRVSYTFSRQFSQEDSVKTLKDQAIKPGYSTLVDKIDGYTGRIMGYKCYVVDIAQSGDSWVLKLALVKNAKGYKNLLYAVTNSQPEVTVDEHVMMYGQCTGLSQGNTDTGADGTDTGAQSYPTFDLLLITGL